MKSQVLHTAWCNIFAEAAGKIWYWSDTLNRNERDKTFVPRTPQFQALLINNSRRRRINIRSSITHSRSTQKVHSPNPLKRKWISEVVRIGSIIIFYLSKLWSQVHHTVWCNISAEAAGEIWHWSLLGGGVKTFVLHTNKSQCRRTLSLPRVIKFKFLLQPHQ